MISRILATIASAITIGFGLWHFFVPAIWRWYDYVYETATELIVAVRAVNAFFSLSLVLLGSLNLVFIYSLRSTPFALNIVLAVSCLLWFTRVIWQLIYPQGSMNPRLQYGMLAVFFLTFGLYMLALILPRI